MGSGAWRPRVLERDKGPTEGRLTNTEKRTDTRAVMQNEKEREMIYTKLLETINKYQIAKF